MRHPRVENMTGRNGNAVPNQFIIFVKNGVYYQSYSSLIAFRGLDGTVLLDECYWECSTTTSKYRNSFLDENISETQKKIASGEYKLVDLNN